MLNFLLHGRLGTWSGPPPSPPSPPSPTHYFLQFSEKIIALGKPQPMLLGYKQIIPATIDKPKSSIMTPRIVYGKNAFCLREC